jgi:hypothetical protein
LLLEPVKIGLKNTELLERQPGLLPRRDVIHARQDRHPRLPLAD